MKSQRVVFLDALRLLAVLSVIVGHKYYQSIAQAADDPGLHVTLRALAQLISPLVFGGAAGVIVFFLISGYIISHVLRSEAPGTFLLKRAFRIHPLYMAAVIFEIVLGAAVFGYGIPSPSEILIRLLLLGDFFGTINALAAVEWTLRIEMTFYVIMALLKTSGFLAQPRLMPVAVVGATAALHLWSPLPSTNDWNHGYITLYAPFLGIGVLIYLAEHRLAHRFTCVCACLLVFSAFVFAVPSLQPSLKEHHYAVWAVAIFLVFLSINNRLEDLTIVRRAADLSFALYLLHNWLWAHIALLGATLGLGGLALQLFIVSSIIGASWVVHRWLELPGIALGKALSKQLVYERTIKTRS